ncbi:hypothetical protein PCANC_06289 [Puccinia coronata f. sp. avenae]|uniref:Uncharacterized protein n=1 Tax=Puccinia coronata f. sp. avenae TaxID=200324 RepID=A0A2N5VRM6_9BASI|nr:hypothetical protein PCANC_06289 [Puccinia coronata f. sp. avenae]
MLISGVRYPKFPADTLRTETVDGQLHVEHSHRTSHHQPNHSQPGQPTILPSDKERQQLTSTYPKLTSSLTLPYCALLQIFNIPTSITHGYRTDHRQTQETHPA